MWNLCTSVFKNTHAWEQQEWNKTKKQNKKARGEEWVFKEVKGAQKKVPTAETIARAYRPSSSVRLEAVDELPNEHSLHL